MKRKSKDNKNWEINKPINPDYSVAILELCRQILNERPVIGFEDFGPKQKGVRKITLTFFKKE